MSTSKHTLPYYVSLHCEACGAKPALVWYMRAANPDALALCTMDALASHEALAEAGYEVVRDHRPQTREELRKVLLSPAPTLATVLEIEALRAKFYSP